MRRKRKNTYAFTLILENERLDFISADEETINLWIDGIKVLLSELGIIFFTRLLLFYLYQITFILLMPNYFFFITFLKPVSTILSDGILFHNYCTCVSLWIFCQRLNRWRLRELFFFITCLKPVSTILP